MGKKKNTVPTSKFKALTMPKGGDTTLLSFDLFHPAKGDPIISLRQFYSDADGNKKPGKQGLTLRYEDVPQFVENLKATYKALKAELEE